GKTKFLESLMKELKKRGISAAAVKHLGRHYEPDPKKDTTRLAKAGFDPVVGVADGELMIRLSGRDDLWQAISLIQLLSSPDVIFVEGFKNEPIEKIAVGEIEKLPGTVFRAEDIPQIIEYISRRVKEERSYSCCRDEHGNKPSKSALKEGGKMTDVELRLVVNGKKLATNEFVQNMIWETLCGMMRSLKGVEGDVKSIEISAKKV
ncbi:MAG: molybdopterin-guanine dinucleotide biosynthesis protein MobB, partial [Thermoplasmata archaeon]